jgi:hypothetical protein
MEYRVPKLNPTIIKIFIKTKAGGNRAVRKQIKVQIGGWDRAIRGDPSNTRPQSGLGSPSSTPPA